MPPQAGPGGPGRDNNGNAWNNALAIAKKKRPNVTVDHPKRVLFCLDLNNPFRKLCIKFVEWKYVIIITSLYI
jgi:hypothetical protein